MIDQPIPFLFGIGVLVFLCFDLFQTIVQASEGPAARVAQVGIQKIVKGVYRLTGLRQILVWSTSFLIVGLVFMWSVLLYLGWLLIFLGDSTAILRTEDDTPASLTERIYFTGFTISTLGVGDYVPHGALWQFLTTLAALGSFFLLTFMISFLLTVTEKQALRRKLALSIHHLGETPQELIAQNWEPGANQLRQNVLDSILPDLIEFEQQHLDQPILNRFHGSTERNSVQLALVVLDEALSIAEFATETTLPSRFRHARQAITSYLAGFESASRAETCNVPPLPDLTSLRVAQIPLRSSEKIESAYETVRGRRSKLSMLLSDSGWSWQDVVTPMQHGV